MCEDARDIEKVESLLKKHGKFENQYMNHTAVLGKEKRRQRGWGAWTNKSRIFHVVTLLLNIYAEATCMIEWTMTEVDDGMHIEGGNIILNDLRFTDDRGMIAEEDCDRAWIIEFHC